VTDNTQEVVWRVETDPFGNEIGTSIKTVENNLRFPGQYYDAETGLNQNYHRDYNQTLGRYIEADPIGLAGGMNLFIYVINGPMNRIDMTGLLCTYSQSSRKLTCTDKCDKEYLSCQGYSGRGGGRNEPDMQDVPYFGPIPRGDWTVGPPNNRRGPYTRPLTPNAEVDMRGVHRNNAFNSNRDPNSFLIHGDNARNDASEGCLILPLNCRQKIPTGETLRVVQ
jgi:RHS repeat-associated protein